MAFDPLGLGKAYSWGKNLITDPLEGETVTAHKPNQDNFEYKGFGESTFYQKGRTAENRQLPWQVNAARQNALASREGMAAQMSALQKQMNDPNASAAQQQLRMAQDANMAQAMAIARSAPGGAGSQAAALRQAQFQNSAAGTQTQQQAAVLRAQEQAGWQQQMAQLAVQQRAADLQAQGLEGQIGLGLMSENDKYALGQYALGQNAAALAQKGLMGFEMTKSGNAMAASMANAQIDAQRDASLMGMVGMGVGGLALGGAFGSDVRGKTDIAPTGPVISGPYATSMGAVDLPTQDMRQPQMNQAQPEQPSNFDNKAFGNFMMQNGLNMMGGSGQPAGPNPYSYLNYGNLVDSDARAKKLEGELDALRGLVGKLTGAGHAAEAVAPRPMEMRRGMAQPPPDALDRQRAAVTDEASAARYGAEWLKAQGRADALEQVRQLREQQALAAAREKLSLAEANRSMGDALSQRTSAEMVDSDERAKDVIAAIRQRAQDGEPSNETASFIARARERMAEDQEKKLDEALLRASLDRIEREATVDGGAPRLQAGRTNVARFADVPPTVQAAAETPNYQWRYKDQFATEANTRAGLPPTAPQGFARRTGPMAQDLERSPLYAPAVVTGPDGMKRVDSGTVSMANTGVLSDLARFAQDQEARLQRLEASRSRGLYPTARGTGGL